MGDGITNILTIAWVIIMVIGAKRYFYNNIQKIQSESLKYILKTYTITTTDGKVKTYVVMFGSKNLNKELGKYVMMNYEK